LPSGKPCLHANDARGARYWIPLSSVNDQSIQQALTDLQRHIGKPIVVFPHGSLVANLRPTPSTSNIQLYAHTYRPVLPNGLSLHSDNKPDLDPSPHIKWLEAESIHIIREAVAEAQNPVMMYSIGKDSGVMLHLARKAFYPAPPPFPLLHIDTRWKFQEMYLFRDFVARESGMDLLVHTNPEAIEKNINPFDHGSALHTDITKTEGLKQALDHYKFDVVFGGARRDEEKSRAKERVFSFRTATHRWDPKNQRPELWNLYNTRKSPNESIRVFPLSNWSELDIWQYIYQENIPMVPLYFAKPRPVVVRPEMIMMVDDERCRLLPNEYIQIKKVRFRTLGCYPLTGAVESEAETIEDILLEVINARQSERQGRKIDTDSAGSMEKKKQEGYF
jgi:sulfate adenylyltransferase subunit 2